MSEEQNYKGKYIALEKIETVTRDGEMNIILFKNGMTIRLPDALMEKMVTEKPAQTKGMDLNPTQLRMMTIVDDIEILLRKVYCLSVGEVDTFCQYLQTVVGNNFNLATRLLWSGKNKYKLSLAEMIKVIEDNADVAAKLQKELNEEGKRAQEIKRNQPV